eukprot:347530_1
MLCVLFVFSSSNTIELANIACLFCITTFEPRTPMSDTAVLTDCIASIPSPHLNRISFGMESCLKGIAFNNCNMSCASYLIVLFLCTVSYIERVMLCANLSMDLEDGLLC